MFQHIATFLTVWTLIRFALDELGDAIHDDLRAAYKLFCGSQLLHEICSSLAGHTHVS